MKVARLSGFIIALLTVAIFVGCNKNEDRSSRTDNPYTGDGSLPVVGSAYYQETEFVINGTEIAAKNFLAPNVAGDLTRIGSIRNGDVTAKAYVVVNRSNGQILAGSSLIRFTIRDSLVGTTGPDGYTLPPFEFTLYGKGGTVNGSTVDITFGDNAGTVRVLGALNKVNSYNNSAQLTGRIDFNNTGSWPSNGTLGQFTVQACGFFDCGK